ncbi:MAG: ABC transporter permease, partial [Bryobacteraceae bacterium]
YTDENRVFQDVGMYALETASITGVAQPEEVPGLSVTHGFLPALRVQPALGRPFTSTDTDTHGELTVMLSDGYWRSRFGGDPSAIGRRILMDGEAREVIGVLPASFEFLDRPISFLLPLRVNRAEIRLISFCCQGIARLRPGVTLAQANADVARMLPLAPLKFAINPGFSPDSYAASRIAPRLRPLKDVLVGDVGTTLWLLLGTVGIVLLIACANVANLLLVRAVGRRQEFAVRAALGAGWGRIASELITESLLLGVAGGALGLALAYAALRTLAASDFSHLPRLHNTSIDPTVLTFTLLVSLASGLLFGVIPVFKYGRPHPSNALRGGGRSLTDSKERHHTRSVLVVVQVALALVLLIGSGLMIRTFRALRGVDPGFTGAAQVESVRISIPEMQVKEPERAVRAQEAILHRLEAIASVSRVAMINYLPLEGGNNDPIYAKGHSAAPGEVPAIRRYKFISPGYVATVGARLVAGRDLTWTETFNQTPVALVSENLAREIWRDPQSAIGKRIRSTLKDDWREVIGVVADLRDNGIDQKPPTIVYWPLLQKNFESTPITAMRTVAFVIRTPRASSTSLREDIERAVAAVNPNLPLAEVKTLGSVYDLSLARTSFTLLLLLIAGGMALFLGIVGLYGVISYSISQRTREIGIRIALGAPVMDVTGMFVRHGLVLSGAGVICGLAGAFALTRLMKSLLFDISPSDPMTYGTASLTLLLAAAIASYVPARRATRVDPVEALRAE